MGLAQGFRTPGAPFPFDPPTLQVVAGGVVAHNDEERVDRAIRSLLTQRLPNGYRWGRISVVASGCTDRTVEVAESIAREDGRLDVIVEAERRGKAAAIEKILQGAQGDAVVLLNSDAVALPGSVAELLTTARGKSAPYAVMARPVVPPTASGEWSTTMRWMWDLHHELHLEMLADGHGAHLSDELLLLSLPVAAPLGAGIINDGSYLGVWFAEHGGGCWYAPESRVAISTPPSVGDHLWQRRRIHVGNSQVRQLLGRSPTTLPSYFLDDPARAYRALRAMLGRPDGARQLARVAFWELVAHGLACWDRLPPARDHVRWRRIRDRLAQPSAIPSTPTLRRVSPAPEVERRIRSVLAVAQEFGTGVPLDRLGELLPPEAPRTAPELRRWLEGRPDLARVDADRVSLTPAPAPTGPDRTQLAAEYRRVAEELLDGPLRSARRWIRCAGITGSVAYGEPRPGDDLDFFVVTSTGALWWFVAVLYLALRRARRRGTAAGWPELCFNYLVDDSAAPAEFGSDRGFLFARESLTAKVVHGDPYFRGLLAGASWMGRSIPRLYTTRTESPGASEPTRAPRLVRLLNAVAYPLVATYLQLAGLRRNARLAAEGKDRWVFRTLTGWHRLAFASRRFEQLRACYEEDPSSEATEGMAGPTRLPTAR